MRLWRLVKWRYKTPYGEIDLILRKGSQLRFIEVKYRSHHITDAPITAHQLNRLYRASHYAYHALSPHHRHQAQFDIIIVTKWGRLSIYSNHMPE